MSKTCRALPEVRRALHTLPTFSNAADGTQNWLGFENMIRVFDQHFIKPVIDSVYDFENLGTGWDRFAVRNLFGKVVVSH